MGIKISFPQKPSKEEIQEMEKATEKFAHIATHTAKKAEETVGKAKTPIEIIVCKFLAQYRHSELMRIIRKKEREIKKKYQEKNNHV